MEVLGEVRRLMAEAAGARARQKKAEGDLAAYRRRLIMAGGAYPNKNRMGALQDLAKTNHGMLKRAVDGLVELGVEVKDVEEGLVDFPARYRGRDVYLCYRMGEERIGFWHGVEEGLAGRKEIDAEFLAGLELDM
jgi:hypothetical protein